MFSQSISRVRVRNPVSCSKLDKEAISTSPQKVVAHPLILSVLAVKAIGEAPQGSAVLRRAAPSSSPAASRRPVKAFIGVYSRFHRQSPARSMSGVRPAENYVAANR